MDTVCNEFAASFANNFSFLKGKRIVLYGLGYRTGGLIDALGDEFSFVGLMDRDAENIGKIFFGRKVLSEAEATSCAEAIVIISASFYDVIFKRIAHLWTERHIPIYFPTGQQAEQGDKTHEALPEAYAALSLTDIKEHIKAFAAVSFDVFDTLLMRRFLESDAVFFLAEFLAQREGFYKLRKEAYLKVKQGKEPTWANIYDEITALLGGDESAGAFWRGQEWKAESCVLMPRDDMLTCFHYAKELGKDVYIVSDMYFSRQEMARLLSLFEINVPEENLIVSSEYQKSKEGGDLFSVLKEKVGGKGQILHIGDDPHSDVSVARRQGLSALRIYSAKDLMRHTALHKFLKEEYSLLGRAALGLIAAKLFNSPFAAGRIDARGRLMIRDGHELGYAAYGLLIFSYLSYLVQMCRKENIKKLLFCARDGFLLKKAFDVYISLLGIDDIEGRYLKTSRLLMRKMLLEDDAAIEEFARLAYRGSKQDFFWQRFGLTWDDETEIEMPRDFAAIRRELSPFTAEIIEGSLTLGRRYREYLQREIGDMEGAALVDFGYTGSTQYSLSRFLAKPLTGFYILADMSEENGCNAGQRKYSYLFDKGDPRGQRSVMQKLFMLLEAVYTAPYGTFLSLKEGGDFITAPMTKNGEYFAAKEEIHEGVIAFMRDMAALLGQNILALDVSGGMGTELMATIFSDQVTISGDVLDTFYHDDILKYRTDRKMFD